MTAAVLSVRAGGRMRALRLPVRGEGSVRARGAGRGQAEGTGYLVGFLQSLRRLVLVSVVTNDGNLDGFLKRRSC